MVFEKGGTAMPKIFSVASWNVEHFKNTSPSDNARVQRVANFISGQNGGPSTVPDIFAVYEVEGKDVYREGLTEYAVFNLFISCEVYCCILNWYFLF